MNNVLRLEFGCAVARERAKLKREHNQIFALSVRAPFLRARMESVFGESLIIEERSGGKYSVRFSNAVRVYDARTGQGAEVYRGGPTLERAIADVYLQVTPELGSHFHVGVITPLGKRMALQYDPWNDGFCRVSLEKRGASVLPFTGLAKRVPVKFRYDPAALERPIVERPLSADAAKALASYEKTLAAQMQMNELVSENAINRTIDTLVETFGAFDDIFIKRSHVNSKGMRVFSVALRSLEIRSRENKDVTFLRAEGASFEEAASRLMTRLNRPLSGEFIRLQLNSHRYVDYVFDPVKAEFRPLQGGQAMAAENKVLHLTAG